MVKPSASAPKLPLEPLDSLVDLACRDGVEIRPTLLRVLTDLYVQKPTHSAEEETQYVALALGLIDAVDPQTRAIVTATLSAYAGAPEAILRKLDSLTSSDRGEPAAADLIDLFFSADADERRLILVNLDVAADAARLRPLPVASELIRRLEKAALQRNTGEFSRVLERALGVSRELATRIARDNFGEPMVVAAKALGMNPEMLQRILLCLNPVIGQSVERVFELSCLFDELNPAAVHHMLTIWRATVVRRHVVTQASSSVVTQASSSVRPRGPTSDVGVTSSVCPRDPAYARFASSGGFKSAEALSAKAESGDPEKQTPSVRPLGPRFRGDEREGVGASTATPTGASSYESVYWNDERRSARQTATRTPPRAEPTAQPARFKSSER